MVASCTTPEFEFVDSDAATAPPHCQNQVQDEGESDIDCGGACTRCALTQQCNTADDCRESQCNEGTCQAAGCTDKTLDGSETDVDCGGGSCKPCAGGLVCARGADCTSGVCGALGCAEPTCGDRVANGSESDIDCGGPDCSPCIAGQTCVTPSDCVGNDCTASKCALSCAAGLGNCDGDPANACETNLRTDESHCGDCATDCALGNAVASCAGGKCRVDSCVAPFADCNGDPADGCEVNTKTDVTNCGACAAKPCATLNGQAYCADSACGITCNPNFSDCDGEAGNGCEKDVSKDVDNCGGCDKKCVASAGKTAWCRNGQCGETTCAAGRGDCNGDPDDDAAHGGCETDFKTDADSCGVCGHQCGVSGGVAQCSNGSCSIKACTAPLADCTGGYADGCETNLNTDASNCGVCTKKCSAAGGVPGCAAGTCQINSCSGTFLDCNLTVGDGCEVNSASNQTHCGSCTGPEANCNTVYPSASAHCANSGCVFDGCATDYANCDTVASNGCEVNSKTDKNHCGNCSTVCAATGASSTSCNAGACAPVCTGTKIFCSNPQNGCVIESATDAANCGSCGKVCDSSAVAHVSSNACLAKVCKPVCASLFADCDSNPGNGCERAVGNDKTNCGGCGITCGSANTTATSCTAGSCTPTCSPGWKNCGAPAAGCNVLLGTTSNCTACGQACTGATPYCTATGCSGHLDIGVVGAGVDASAGFDTSVVPTLTQTHGLTNPSGGFNRTVLVGVAATHPYFSTEQVKYNGTVMNVALQAQTAHSYAGIFYLLDSALPATAGNYPVTVTFTTDKYAGVGAVDVIELKNVQQTAAIVTTANNALADACGTTADRSVTLAFTQPGSFGYAVTGARTGSSATPNPGMLVQTMHQLPMNPWPMAGVAGYAGPINGTTTLTWNIADCWNSASVAVALKRVGD